MSASKRDVIKGPAIHPGLCGCGCGRATRISTDSSRPLGRVKGRPLRFISGHNARVYNPNGWNGHEPGYYNDRRRA